MCIRNAKVASSIPATGTNENKELETDATTWRANWENHFPNFWWIASIPIITILCFLLLYLAVGAMDDRVLIRH